MLLQVQLPILIVLQAQIPIPMALQPEFSIPNSGGDSVAIGI